MQSAATFRGPETAEARFSLFPSVFAVAGMGALFAATVRAPLTGIALAVEMTGNYIIILPLILPGLAAASLIVFAYTFGAFEVPLGIVEQAHVGLDRLRRFGAHALYSGTAPDSAPDRLPSGS